jgi:hypothetical protein
MSDLDDEFGEMVRRDLPDPYLGVPDDIALIVKNHINTIGDTVAELIILMDKGSSIAFKLPKIITGKGKSIKSVEKYPLLHSALLRHNQDLQRKRLVLDTFG